MTVSHHGGNEMSEELKQELEASRRFIQERLGEAQRKYPGGRISADDEGEAAFAISSDDSHNLVRIDFNKPMEWLALEPDQAVQLAQMLIKHARNVATEPLAIVLH